MAALTVIVLRYIFLLLVYSFIIHMLLVLWKDIRLKLYSYGPTGAVERAIPAKLLVISSGSEDISPGDRVLLKDRNLLGRSPNNDIQLDDLHVSGHHAVIYLQDTNYWLEDVGSTNGTKLNDCYLSRPSPLSQGDTVKVGSTTFLFSMDR